MTNITDIGTIIYRPIRVQRKKNAYMKNINIDLLHVSSKHLAIPREVKYK